MDGWVRWRGEGCTTYRIFDAEGGAPGMTRTCGAQIRNLELYPPELRGHVNIFITTMGNVKWFGLRKRKIINKPKTTAASPPIIPFQLIEKSSKDPKRY